MIRKPKVLIVSKELGSGGGVANFVSMLLSILPEFVECEHFKVGEPRSGKGGFRKLVWPIMDNVRLFLRLSNGDISCIHINPSMNWNAFMRDALLLMTARIARFNKFIVFFHGWDERFAEQIGRSSIYRFLLQKVYGRAGIIIVLAERFREQLLTLGVSDDRIVVSTTMFDGSLFEGLERDSNQDTDDNQRIVFLSRFVRDKGVFELLEAFIQVRQQFSGANLVLAGDGPARRSMESYVREQGLSDSVQFAGYLRGRDKAELLRNSDVFVLPTSHPEGCPVALLEAMAAELPIVTTPIGGIADFFVDGENGILLQDICPASVAKAILRLLDDADLRRQIGRHNQSIAWKRFEARIVSKWIADQYRVVARIIN